VPTPKEKRPRITRTDEWQTIKQLSLWPEQVTYEMIRPVVLFSETPAERAKETGEARRSLYRKVEQFEEQGMLGIGADLSPSSEALDLQERSRARWSQPGPKHRLLVHPSAWTTATKAAQQGQTRMQSGG
jgi:hypothetical protein